MWGRFFVFVLCFWYAMNCKGIFFHCDHYLSQYPWLNCPFIPQWFEMHLLSYIKLLIYSWACFWVQHFWESDSWWDYARNVLLKDMQMATECQWIVFLSRILKKRKICWAQSRWNFFYHGLLYNLFLNIKHFKWTAKLHGIGYRLNNCIITNYRRCSE